jgi:translation initiation factor 1 (eIF-1/SUI1)
MKRFLYSQREKNIRKNCAGRHIRTKGEVVRVIVTYKQKGKAVLTVKALDLTCDKLLVALFRLHREF